MSIIKFKNAIASADTAAMSLLISAFPEKPDNKSGKVNNNNAASDHANGLTNVLS